MTERRESRESDLTLREAELQLRAELEWRTGHLREHELLAEAHREKHESEQLAVNKAEQAQQAAIDAARQAVEQAGEAQRALVKNSLEDHHREHLTHESSHAREHTLVGDALSKAESSMDKRLESVSLRFSDTTKHTDERYEDNRKRIEAIEKGDVEQKGWRLGQGSVVAIIVGAIVVVGTVLGIIVTLANLATGNP